MIHYTRITWIIFGLSSILCTERVVDPAIFTVKDSQPYHVHPPGKPFNVTVTNRNRESMSMVWTDFTGRSMTTPQSVQPDEQVIVLSPSGDIGYYGLLVSGQGQQHEYGFAVLPSRKAHDRVLEPDSVFGVVHADINDPYLRGWVKAATWKKYDLDYWHTAMLERRSRGLTELPLVIGDEWSTDPSQPVPESKLTALGKKLQRYFAADPNIIYWELGIEENITGSYRHRYYWPNLAAKARVAKEAAKVVKPNIQFLYQIAGLDSHSVEQFLKSEASKYFDILALHPYAWPDFRDPETWLSKYLSSIRTLQERYGREMPIWFTEIGAPQHQNRQGGQFNYKSAINVRGLSRHEAVSFLIKMHVLALHEGVKKIFWYNYRDRGSLSIDPENYFGLRDFEGFLKPVYVAYFVLHQRLRRLKPSGHKHLSGKLWVHEFTGQARRCSVLWSSNEGAVIVALIEILPDVPLSAVRAINAIGAPLATETGTISVGTDPVYVCTDR